MTGWIIIGAVSLLSGLTASMGLGGGFVLVIYLTVFAGVSQLAAQSINLVFFLPIAAASLFFHLRGKLVEKSILLFFILPELVGVFGGVFLANFLGSSVLSKVFAGFVLLIGIRELFHAFSHKENDKEKSPEPK